VNPVVSTFRSSTEVGVSRREGLVRTGRDAGKRLSSALS